MDELIYPGGWYHNPAEVDRILATMPNPEFGDAEARTYGSQSEAVPDDVCYWDYEQAALGMVRDSINQLSVGSCVGAAYAGAAEDELSIEAVLDNIAIPSVRVCIEAMYGASRVEIGGGRLRGDGSNGSWAAKAAQTIGTLFYQKYDVNGVTYDLSGGYTVARCRDWGSRGVPDVLEPTAKQVLFKDATLITSLDALWTLLGDRRPVVVCGDISRPYKRSPGGWCYRTGTDWAHAQRLRGRLVVKGNKRAVIYNNSWGNYLGSDNNRVTLESGKEITLPQGAYIAPLEELDFELRQRDTFALFNTVGLAPRKINYAL